MSGKHVRGKMSREKRSDPTACYLVQLSSFHTPATALSSANRLSVGSLHAQRLAAAAFLIN